MFNNWFKKEKPFLSGTSTSGGAGGFAVGGGGPSYNPFTLTLDASDRSWQGDPASVVTNWWSSQAATHQGSLITTGSWQYQGYYQATLDAPATVQVTAGGAAGWCNNNGRSIRATFSIAAGTKIVFFAGKATEAYASGSQQNGAGGGASMFAIQPPNPNVLTAYVVAAGGGGGSSTHPVARADWLCAPALQTNQATILNERDAAFSNYNIGTDCGGNATAGGGGGLGRSEAPPAPVAQSGGAGWHYPSFEYSGPGSVIQATLNTANNSGRGIAYALSQGAMGARVPLGGNGGADGGFGGGGMDVDGNSYGAGGGGYWGGCENAASQPAPGIPAVPGEPSNGYLAYIWSGQRSDDPSQNKGTFDCLGAQSYVNPVASSYADLGYHGPTSYSASNAGQTGGQVELQFTF